jgi:hypothetical protein
MWRLLIVAICTCALADAGAGSVSADTQNDVGLIAVTPATPVEAHARPDYRPIVVATPAAVAARENFERVLDQETKMDFTDTQLSDAVTYLKDYHNIEIQLDTKGLEDASIGPETPVTCRLEKMTLRAALRFFLGAIDLTFVIHDEMLLITTREKAANMLVVKIYPVADLVAPRDGTPPGDALQPLVEVLHATVVPTTSPARPNGVLIPIPQSQSLVVMQTDEVHERVAELLAGLRTARELQAGR